MDFLFALLGFLDGLDIVFVGAITVLVAVFLFLFFFFFPVAWNQVVGVIDAVMGVWALTFTVTFVLPAATIVWLDWYRPDCEGILDKSGFVYNLPGWDELFALVSDLKTAIIFFGFMFFLIFWCISGIHTGSYAFGRDFAEALLQPKSRFLFALSAIFTLSRHYYTYSLTDSRAPLSWLWNIDALMGDMSRIHQKKWLYFTEKLKLDVSLPDMSAMGPLQQWYTRMNYNKNLLSASIFEPLNGIIWKLGHSSCLNAFDEIMFMGKSFLLVLVLLGALAQIKYSLQQNPHAGGKWKRA